MEFLFVGEGVWGDGFLVFYKKGMKHGYGIYTWPDNSVFQGDWAENLITGYGKY